MSSWLDTETKALLQKSPPNTGAPPDTRAFTLVLISIWHDDPARLVRAVRRIRLGSREDAESCLRRGLPSRIKASLTHADALLGQFELVSCDAVSVFLADEVVAEATREYLADLYETLRRSDEFAATSVRIEKLPDDERGASFVDQFLGHQVDLSAAFVVPRKKARIMRHWAGKIGGRLIVRG